MTAGKSSSTDTSVDMALANFFTNHAHLSPLAEAARASASGTTVPAVSLDLSLDTDSSDDDTRSSRSSSGSHRGSVEDFIRTAQVAYQRAEKATAAARELIESKHVLYPSDQKCFEAALRRAEILHKASVKALERAEARSFTAKLGDLGSASPARR